MDNRKTWQKKPQSMTMAKRADLEEHEEFEFFYHRSASSILSGDVRTLYDEPILPRRRMIAFAFSNANYYMRTDTFTESSGFVDIIRVMKNNRYKHYEAVYVLTEFEAKEAIQMFRHTDGVSIRGRFRDYIIEKSLYSFNRAAFYSSQSIFSTLRTIFPSEPIETLTSSVKSGEDISRRGIFLRNNTKDMTI